MTFDTFNLWPFPSWLAIVISVAIVAGAYLAARHEILARNQSLLDLASGIRAAGLHHDALAFSVTGDRNVLLAASGSFAILEPRRGLLVQTVPLEEVRGLKIHERGAEDIEFRLILRNRAESRRIRTRSIAEFSHLFRHLMRAGKSLEYIQE